MRGRIPAGPEVVEHLQGSENRKKRRPDSVVQVWANAALDDSDEEAGLEQVVGNEPTPEFATQFAEEYERRLHGLNNPVRMGDKRAGRWLVAMMRSLVFSWPVCTAGQLQYAPPSVTTSDGGVFHARA
jgi:hypothetical protein